jgi:hypothetical protein
VQEDPVLRRGDFTGLTPVTNPVSVTPPARRWTDEDWAVIRRGYRARETEDRWHAFTENSRLFLHRSWTGFGVYEAQFDRDGIGWHIRELLVCGDRGRYRRLSHEGEAPMVESLIDNVLLGRWPTR